MFENPRRGRQARNFWKKCSENSRSQIVFPTDIFRKLSLGAPAVLTGCTHESLIRTFNRNRPLNSIADKKVLKNILMR